MASEPITSEFPLHIREQIARIDRTQAEIDTVDREMRFAPLTLAFSGLAAGAAFAKLILG